MNRIDVTFQKLQRPALITFITAGDPDIKKSQSILDLLPASGADIIELGMPFTDPMADGPTIQAAALRALDAGANMKTTLQMVRDFRVKNETTPIVLMGYANPVYQYGLQDFVGDASDAGVDGLIIVDLPPEEDDALYVLSKAANIHLIKLVTPTTSDDRLKTVLPKASGFLYYVSITGITGAASADVTAVKNHVESIRKATDLPLAIGFGIKGPDDVRQFAAFADAVVVGSAIVNEANKPNGDVSAFVKSLQQAL